MRLHGLGDAFQTLKQIERSELNMSPDLDLAIILIYTIHII